MKDRLCRSEAHLWVVRPEDITAPELLRAYETLLTTDERDKRDRFRCAQDRHHCLVTRALVRSVLSRYADVAPERWRFVTNQYGRPEVVEPRLVRPLRFNLSHTNGLIVCLVAADRDVGVDAERRQPSADLLDVAHRYFSPFEIAALSALPRREQLDRVIMYWTLKESFIKAKGMGLAFPLTQLSFNLDDRNGQGIRMFIDPRQGDDPESWQFVLLSYGRGHVIAASIRRQNGDTVSLNLRDIVPLRD